MSLSVQHLNGDSTFLLSFFPERDASQPGRHSSPVRPFRILSDPWLTGSSFIWTARFSISTHTCDSVVDSLADLPMPDLILISQDKSDHCHEETLRTLPADSRVHILAVPAAAAKIKSWKYFTHATITTLPIYNHSNPNSILRFPVKPADPSGCPGEITISYIPQKYDVTNLHNVIGITYQSPSANKVRRPVAQTAQLPPSPPITPTTSQPASQNSSQDLSALPQIFRNSPAPDIPLSPMSASPGPKLLSVLYAPHGIGIPCITPFMKHYLAPLGALPLTLLLHCINVEQNPWFLGGLVAPGFPGGLALAKTFGARYWLSAHDEPKDNRGWATVMIKSRPYTLHEAQLLLDDELERADMLRHASPAAADQRFPGPTNTRLVNLDVGEHLTMKI